MWSLINPVGACPASHRSHGFTLLEMLVVILLVSLLSGMLMQGFIYMAGVYGGVERRQSAMQSQSLVTGWLQDSVTGIVNGIDHQPLTRHRFRGDDAGFEAISLNPLASQLYGHPHKIQWRLEQDGDLVSLFYREQTLPGGAEGLWFNVKTWRGVTARWLYLADGEWAVRYPQASLMFNERRPHILPQAVALEIVGGREPEIVIVTIATDDQQYRRHEEPGV